MPKQRTMNRRRKCSEIAAKTSTRSNASGGGKGRPPTDWRSISVFAPAAPPGCGNKQQQLNPMHQRAAQQDNGYRPLHLRLYAQWQVTTGLHIRSTRHTAASDRVAALGLQPILWIASAVIHKRPVASLGGRTAPADTLQGGGWHPSQINKSDGDEQKRSSVFFRKNRGDTLSCRP